MREFIHVAIALGFVAIGMSGGISSAEELVEYPEGYRNWTHVKSMVIQPGHELHKAFGGIHHIYANEDALEGYKTGRFSDGAILVFDLLEAVEEGNAITEGSRKVLGVMEKDRERFAETGGWGFEGFGSGEAGNRVVGKDAKTACYQCHTSQEQHDYVFSTWRE